MFYGKHLATLEILRLSHYKRLLSVSNADVGTGGKKESCRLRHENQITTT